MVLLNTMEYNFIMFILHVNQVIPATYLDNQQNGFS